MYPWYNEFEGIWAQQLKEEAIRLIKLQPFFDCFYRGTQWSKGQREVLRLRGLAELQINRIINDRPSR